MPRRQQSTAPSPTWRGAWFPSILLLAGSSPALAPVAHEQLVWSPLLRSSSIPTMMGVTGALLSIWVGFPAPLGLPRALLQPWEPALLQSHPCGRACSHKQPCVIAAVCSDSYPLEEIEWVHTTWLRNRHVPRDGQHSRHSAALLGCSGGSLHVLRGSVCLFRQESSSRCSSSPGLGPGLCQYQVRERP